MSDRITTKTKFQKTLYLSFIILIMIFAIAQFVYIAVAFLGSVGTVILGLTSLVKKISLLESFVSAFAFVLCIILTTITFTTRNSVSKAIFFNIAFFFFAITIFETYLHVRKKNDLIAVSLNSVKVNTPSNLWSTNKYLGVVPTPCGTFRVTSTYERDLLYDVNYTIDENSQRISPRYMCGSNGNSLIFFGCSVTFGYGLEDHEAFPYMVGEKLFNQYKIYNFSFGGYGTHHMLSQIEHGIVDEIVDVNPKYVIYTVIPDHLRRIVGDTPWGANDPEYVLEHGNIVYKGLFKENDKFFHKTSALFADSNIADLLFGKIKETKRLELFRAIVNVSRHKINALYPQSKFIVLFWEDYAQPSLNKKMIDALRKDGIEVYPITDFIFDYMKEFQQYQICFPLEQHPNSLANERVSDFIVNKIVKD